MYNFRQGFMLPTPCLKNVLPAYKYINWLFPILRPIFPNFVSTLAEIGLAMINVVARGSEKHILEVRDIVALAK
jgi:hypothetical protein